MTYLIYHATPEGEILKTYDVYPDTTTARVVDQMKSKSPFTRAQSPDEYRQGVLERVGGNVESALSDEAFLQELERLGRARRVRYLTRVFVYGTLMRGGCNHDRYCRQALQTRPAQALGRLYSMGAFPAVELLDEMKVPGEATGDLVEDARLHYRVDMCLSAQDLGTYLDRELDPGDLVQGEVIEFGSLDDLADLDRLEGFRPGGGGLYERSLVPVQVDDEKIVSAWIYHMRACAGVRIHGGRWTA